MNKQLEVLIEEYKNCNAIYQNMFQVTRMKLGMEVKIIRLHDRLEDQGYRFTPDEIKLYQDCLETQVKRNGGDYRK